MQYNLEPRKKNEEKNSEEKWEHSEGIYMFSRERKMCYHLNKIQDVMLFSRSFVNLTGNTTSHNKTLVYH